MKDKIGQHVREAMKNRDTARLSTLRMMLAELVNKEKEKGIPVTDEQSVQIFQTMVRKRRDSIELFRKGSREDLAVKEEQEIVFIEHYLPEQLPEDKIREHVQAEIAELGATGPKEMGKVMGALAKKLAGRADGAAMSRIVREELQKLAP